MCEDLVAFVWQEVAESSLGCFLQQGDRVLISLRVFHNSKNLLANEVFINCLKRSKPRDFFASFAPYPILIDPFFFFLKLINCRFHPLILV